MNGEFRWSHVLLAVGTVAVVLAFALGLAALSRHDQAVRCRRFGERAYEATKMVGDGWHASCFVDLDGTWVPVHTVTVDEHGRITGRVVG